MATTLKIYKTKVTPDRNAIIDNLPSYLSSLTPTYQSDNFQYQKLALNLSIKINATQDKVGASIGNYVDIYQDNKHYYFFIDGNAIWLAKETLQLDLVMDTLNTFVGDYTFSDKTKVNREHRNRWFTSDKYIDGADSFSVHFKVDEVDEGIQPAVMYKTSSTKITDTSSTYANQNWYLVYASANESASSKPLSVLLLPQETSVPYSNGPLGDVVWTKNDVEQGKWYYFFPSDNPNFQAECQGISASFNTSDIIYCVQLSINNTWLSYRCTTSGNWSVVWNNLNAETYDITFHRANFTYRYDSRILDTNKVVQEGFKININAGATGVRYLTSINEIDRSQSNIVKIIELPYLPDSNIHWSGNVINLTNSIFKLNGSALILKEYTSEFEKTIKTVNLSRLNPPIFEIPEGKNIYHLDRDGGLESKMLHSSFYQFKLTYDSFSSYIAFERLVRASTVMPSITIAYKPSNNLGSDMLFKWNFSVSVQRYKEIQDYEKFLSCSRNNELGLYTSDYLNYMRVGYNYDRKEKVRSDTKAWIGTGVTIASAIAAAVFTKGVAIPFAVKAASAAATSLMSIYNTVNSTISTEQSIAKNIAQLQAQGASVQGASAVDLLNWYNENKLWIYEYEPTDVMKKNLQDLFFYCGYATNQQKLPSPNNRYWFDYLQCEPVFTNEDTSTIYYDYLDDIKSRYNAGVVYYHVHNNEYDWNQQYENLENSLFQ